MELDWTTIVFALTGTIFIILFHFYESKAEKEFKKNRESDN
jgi:hypothetical protein